MYFDDLINIENCIDDFFQTFDKKAPIIMFGFGFALNRTLLKFEDMGFNIVGICDNDEKKHNTIYKNTYPVFSLYKAMQNYSNATYVISTPKYFDEIKTQLETKVKQHQICDIDFECGHYFSGKEFKKFVLDNRERFQKFYNALSDDLSKKVLYNVTKAHFSGDRIDFINAQSTFDDWYLFKTLLAPNSESVFLDCGAFDGDTIKVFKTAAKDGYTKIYAFEPDVEVQPLLQKTITENNIVGVEIIRKGVYDTEGKLSFSSGGVYSSILDSNKSPKTQNALTTIDVVTIDKQMDGQFVDIIKMDIEGAEYKALIGASETIKKNKPRLAICLYHKIEDFINIQELLLNLVPEYKLLLRHHLPSCTDTILYAY